MAMTGTFRVVTSWLTVLPGRPAFARLTHREII
jgi:hypothetical protein